MPYRLLLYMVEIWRDIFNNTAEKDRERKSFRLPAIIPAVLYNGAGRWTVALNFKEMQTNYRQFEKHLLDFQYILFDVNRYREEELQQVANLVSVIFTLDRKTEQPQEITERLHQAAGTLKDMSSDEFRQFTIWFKNVLKARMPEPVQEKLEEIIDRTNPREVGEMITNIELAIEELQKQALQKGREEGIEKGLEKGREETRLEVAQNLLAIGLDAEKIQQVTGLSKEKIEKLLPRH